MTTIQQQQAQPSQNLGLTSNYMSMSDQAILNRMNNPELDDMEMLEDLGGYPG